MLIKINSRIILVLCAVILNASCKSTSVGSGNLTGDQDNKVTGTWVKSQEENKGDGITVFRRPDFPFPPSRGRERFEFEGKTVVYHKIAATDGLERISGTWTFLSKKDELLLTFENGTSMSYQIVSASDDRLMLKFKP